MQSQEIGFRCPNSAAPATHLCIFSFCTANPYLCSTFDCSCHNSHMVHPTMDIAQFMKQIRHPPKQDDLIGTVSTLLDDMTQLTTSARSSLNRLLQSSPNLHPSQQELYRRLLAGQQPAELNGQSLCDLLDSLRRVADQPKPEQNQRMKLVRSAVDRFRRLAQDIRRSLDPQAFQQTAENEFTSKVLEADYVEELPRDTKVFQLEGAFTNNWAAIGQGLLDLHMLDTVDLKDCAGGDVLCDFLSRCRHLKRLRMNYCEVTDDGVDFLTNSNNLIELNLNDNRQITMEGFKNVLINLKGLAVFKLKMPHLNALQIAEGLEMKDKGAEFVANNLVGLTVLDIDGNEVEERGATRIASQLRKLTSLAINDNPIGDGGIKAICKLTNITKLYLNDVKMTADGVQALTQLNSLTTLGVGENSIGDTGAEMLARSLPKLSWLNMHGDELTERGALALSLNLKQLKTLSVGFNRLGDVGAELLAKGLPLLEKLFIARNNIGDRGMTAIIKHLDQLNSLIVDRNDMGEECAVLLANCSPRLTFLQIGNAQLGDRAALALAVKLPLMKLDIEDNFLTERCSSLLQQVRVKATLNF